MSPELPPGNRDTGARGSAFIAVCLLRSGLVCALSEHVGSRLVEWMIGTLDLRDWYADPMLVVLAVMGALVAWGAWVSLGRRPIFGDMLAEPQPKGWGRGRVG